MFDQYEKILPGTASKIMEMAEVEQKHRIKMDATVLESETDLAKWGQIFGLVTSILCIGGAVLLGYFGMQWLGGVLAGMSAIGLVKEFSKRRAGH